MSELHDGSVAIASGIPSEIGMESYAKEHGQIVVHEDYLVSSSENLTSHRIEDMERALLESGTILLDLPVKNYFSKDVYARELLIPKGTVLTGKIHKYANLNILSKGDISVLTEDGIKRICAPFTIVSPPGTKRIAYAHEDSIWTTIHGTDETDLEVIEEHFTADSYEEYLKFCEKLKIEGS